MNPNVQFKYPLTRLIWIVPIFLYSIFLSYIICIILPVYHLLIIAIVNTALTLGVLVFFDGTYHYFKYKKLFSKHNFKSIQDIIVATNGEYDDFDKIDSELRLLREGRFMSGFEIKMDKEGSFIFYDRNHYQNKAELEQVKREQPKQKPTSNANPIVQQVTDNLNSVSSTTEQVQMMLELLENGTISKEDIMNAPEPTVAQELEIISNLHKEGTISDEEFQKIKSDILKQT